jgi:hypothetical protein
MAVLSNTSKPNLKKILLLGDSGSGKTGSLVSLALAGYSIKIIDFDAQAEEVIRGFCQEHLVPQVFRLMEAQ